MPTFRLISKVKIGSGSNFLSEGVFIQISKDCTAAPSNAQIKQAIKQQFGIDVPNPHLGQFNWEMVR
jgi:hypothetical protein